MDFKLFIIKLPLKEKYLSILTNKLTNNSKNSNKINNYTKKGKITITKYIVWTENKLSYEDFIENISENLKIDELQLLNYIGQVEDILDKNTKVGVGYGIIYNFLQSFDKNKKQNLLRDEIIKKLEILKKVYEKRNKKTDEDMNKFYNFLDYINAQIYLNEALENNRYTFEDISDIKDIEKEFFKDEIVINLEVFLTFLYKNVLKVEKVEKDENFILETIGKYPGYGIFLIQRIYRKYIDKDFEPEKKPDGNFDHIVVI